MEITKENVRERIGELKGKIFSVSFTKKDGSLRNMLCRTGVKKHLQGGELKYNPIDKGLLTVWDLQKKGYRMVNLESLISIKIQGEVTEFEA